MEGKGRREIREGRRRETDRASAVFEERTFLLDFVQLDVDLFAQYSNWIAAQPSDYHRTNVRQEIRLPECGNPPTNALLPTMSRSY